MDFYSDNACKKPTLPQGEKLHASGSFKIRDGKFRILQKRLYVVVHFRTFHSHLVSTRLPVGFEHDSGNSPAIDICARRPRGY
ncbi:MAG: hypothetical protein RIC38_12175, partial [Chromatocurvus sp.]